MALSSWMLLHFAKLFAAYGTYPSRIWTSHLRSTDYHNLCTSQLQYAGVCQKGVALFERYYELWYISSQAYSPLSFHAFLDANWASSKDDRTQISAS